MSKVSADSIKNNVLKLVSFKTRHILSDTTSDSTGIGAARRWIYHKMKAYSKRSGGRLEVSYEGYLQQPKPLIPQPTKIVNIVAILPGTHPQSRDRLYVTGAHYDSWLHNVMDDSSYAPGANDDASGTAAVMEMARVMSQYKFDATLVFVAFAGTRQGYLGSKYFVDQIEQHRKNRVTIAGYFNNDMIGNGKLINGEEAHSVRVFSQGVTAINGTLSRYEQALLSTGGENDTRSRELGRFVHDIAQKYMPDFKVNLVYRVDRLFFGGNQSSFLKAGYPAVRFTEMYDNYKHQYQYVRKENGVQYGDLPRFLDYHYIAEITRLNVASLAMLANAPARPEGAQLVFQYNILKNSTVLRWSANREPDLKGYVVVWRKTHAPYWQHRKFVGKKTKVTLPLNKNDYIFGVRAIDSFGYYSPAVYCLPVLSLH